MAKDISISICVPAFNEEKTIREAVEDLFKTLSSYVRNLEIIIVDDGSTDSTPQLAEQIVKEYPQIKIIHHKKNLGIGSCYRNALAQAQGDYFTWFPSDHENSAEQFIQCLPYLRQDTLVTYHHLGYDHRPFLRRRISRIYTWIINKSFHLDLKYYNDLTIFPTSVLRFIPLVTNGFVFFAESLIQAIQYGCRVVELQAPLRKRDRGKSKTFTFLSVIRMINDLLHIFITQRALKKSITPLKRKISAKSQNFSRR